jgi:uncharacterized protein (TIGR03083 family)
MNQMWTTIAAERGSLADDLGTLGTEKWATASLCDPWTVEQTLAHLTSTAQLTPPKFIAGFLGSGFNFTKFTEKGLSNQLGATAEETLEKFRRQQHSTSSPPGPKTSWLGETLIHAEDIRRPLGITHTYPTDAVVQVLDFYKGSDTLIGARTRIKGLTLKATDTDWTHGGGPLVEGPALSLLMAATGRATALDDLSGEGLDEFRSRWTN